MTELQLEQLLGRTLTVTEQVNLDLYLEIARQRLENILCFSLDVVDSSPGESPAEEERLYDSRNGYRTLYVDPYVSISEVLVDDEAVTDYKSGPRTIVFSSPMDDEAEVKITAQWGFTELPAVLSLLLARMFALVSKEQKSQAGVRSKSIEGFSVTYDGSTGYQQFLLDNKSLIYQYRQCAESLDHGSVRWRRFR
jgi:hypothetical protein